MKYEIKYGIGKSKYVVSYHDGVKLHNDGSMFFDINIFSSQKKMNSFINFLLSKGYTQLCF